MLLICRFDIRAVDAPEFMDHAEHALRLLTAQTGCVGGELARATEDSESWVLSVRFDSIVAYRRAMSGFEIREHVIPLLSRARDEGTATHELIVTAAEGGTERHPSILASDAETVRPGEAGGPTEPR